MTRALKIMYQGVLQSSGSVVVILLDSFEFLEILDHLVSETRPSSFTELSLAEQFVSLCIS
jgi:hypothetical protein